jgi:enoyl-CoA hydratase/carnithine racemase
MSTAEPSPEEWARGHLDDLDLDETGTPRRPVVIVRDDGAAPRDVVGPRPAPGPVVIVVSDDASRLPRSLAERADVVLTAGPPTVASVVVADPLAEARSLAARIAGRPVAALTLAWLLRAEARRDARGALVAESAAYSTLLASEEFRTWRRGRPARVVPADLSPRVAVRREADRLIVTMDNPARRNAMDSRMRDALLEALEPARWDPGLTVELRAAGPSSGSGGDLDEFGLATDVGRAHLTRTTASLGLVLMDLRGRVTARVHGDCFGAGIEVPAFADDLVAAPGSTFTLPELSMGLIPGAGGTVSIAGRIGRWRTAWLALSGAALPAPTALEWGLVDRVE